LNLVDDRTSLAALVPQGWSQAFVLSAIASLLVVMLTEGGTWAWVLALGTFTAALAAPMLLSQPWWAATVLIVPAVFTGEMWTFQVGTGSRITAGFVVVSACSLITIFGLLRQRVDRRRLPLLKLFLLFEIGVLLSGISAVSKLHWARGVIEVSIGYGFFLLGYLGLQNRIQLHAFLKLFLGLGVVTVLFGMIQYWLNDLMFGLYPLLYDAEDIGFVEHWHGIGRMVANWAHPSNLGSIINLTAPIALYYYLESDRIQLKYILVYGFMVVGVLMTSTRTPMVALLVSSGVLVILLRRRISRLVLPMTIFVVIVLAIAPFVFSSLQRFDLSDQRNEETIEGRNVLRYEAYLLFLQNPGLGVGARNYQDRVFFADPALRGNAAHNVFIEIAAETGLLGLVAFLALLYVALRSDFRWAARPPAELRGISCALFASCLAILVECLAENSLYVWQIWCLFWLLRGISMAIRARSEAFSSPNSPYGSEALAG
jgi:O-antigen ligase